MYIICEWFIAGRSFIHSRESRFFPPNDIGSTIYNLTAVRLRHSAKPPVVNPQVFKKVLPQLPYTVYSQLHVRIPFLQNTIPDPLIDLECHFPCWLRSDPRSKGSRRKSRPQKIGPRGRRCSTCWLRYKIKRSRSCEVSKPAS